MNTYVQKVIDRIGHLFGSGGCSAGASVSLADSSVQSLIDHTPANGVLLLKSQMYEGDIVIEKPITIKGVQGTVIRGSGTGNVITVKAPHVRIENLKIEHGSLSMNSQEEYAGVKVVASYAVLKNLQIADCYHGVYLKNTHHSEVHHVKITGRGRNIVASQGNGIQLIHAAHTRLVGNVIEKVRDGIAFDYSDHNQAEQNQISETRYGLHYMYSNDNTFVDNRFSNNNGGAAIMVSKRLYLRNNDFSFHDGSQAFGILLKSAEEVSITNNCFYQNLRGIYIDDSVGNEIADNQFLYNRVGVELWSSATHQVFTQNRFFKNTVPVMTVGGSVTNQWSKNGKGNDWGGEFPLLDANQDGIGDHPIQYTSALYKLIQENELTYLFLHSPAISIYEKMNQLLHQQSLMFEDEHPLVHAEKRLPLSMIGLALSIVFIGYVWMRRGRKV
ncbi:nitrous oxide reductase family maturation protein NosD [Aneurinibacillus sp. REN35]|uniref:nitrous oxide reductase family maturation protein NosD n=1 Tax=Aneurinibacillus sp. REN35 TaxID=3237286 RepID=UPI003529BC86